MRNTMLKNTLVGAVVLTSGMMCTNLANAAAIIKYGQSYLGVNDQGHLNVYPETLSDYPSDFYSEFMYDPANPSYGGYPVGLWREGLGDATSPGCLCEGWGVAVTSGGFRTSGGATVDNNFPAIFGLSETGTFGSTDSAITSKVSLADAAVDITHAYGRSLANGVFQAAVTIKNNTTGILGDVVYRRAMDWDIPPDEFYEYVSHGGVEANLESNGGNVRFASDDGFSTLDILDGTSSIDANTVNVDFEDNGPADHGSVFDFAFGDINPGESRTFNIFYGTSANEAEALDAISLLGANVYSLGQWGDDPAGTGADFPTFLFAFGGVGGSEPGETADNPVLPFVEAPGEFVFTNPEPGRWFDPPYAYGFEYELTGGALFSSLIMPDASFGFGDIDLMIGGSYVATLSPGEAFDFTTLGYDVSKFVLTGLDTLLDIAAPGFATAFPLFLDWTSSASELLMTALTVDSLPGRDVPAPAPILLLVLAIGALTIRHRKVTLH